MFPFPEKELSIGMLLNFVKPDWVVIWSQRYTGRTYLTRANIYDVLVIQKVDLHDILTLISEYNIAVNDKIRVLYKHYNEPDAMKYTNINKFPLPLIDIYLSHNNFG